ncbi:hypothetical protein CDL15_Pgr000769 [Punica granatum]|uniref:DC1 domain-containing protein n=1 Tax=Punica granatum TaxID=22663 RepID=A0A218W398_PUNGR|nr:hypothetical protein CDL15_Pgr000769 [Punica granatum]
MESAVSMMHPPQDDQSSMDDRREIHHFAHPHCLTYCHAKPELHATCKVCLKNISGGFYCCTECRCFWLNVSCAEFPQEIVHPLHPDHPLICEAGSLKCSLCSHYCDFGFKCRECPFGLHVGYALRSLSAMKEDLSESRLFEHVLEHPMRLRCVEDRNGSSVCRVCDWPLRGLAYACQKNTCSTQIHKACAELIGDESKHPIHPQHPLVLSDQQSNTSDPCSACLQSYHDILLKVIILDSYVL